MLDEAFRKACARDLLSCEYCPCLCVRARRTHGCGAYAARHGPRKGCVLSVLGYSEIGQDACGGGENSLMDDEH